MNLENVKVGDQLRIRGGIGGREPVVIVARITKTQAITESGSRYNIQTGAKVGSSGWDKTWASIATAEDIAQFEHRKLADKLRRVPYDHFNTAALKQIDAILSDPASKQ